MTMPSAHRLLWGVIALAFPTVLHAQLVITEIMHSPLGNDGLWEWVEVRNTTAAPLDLDGWVFDDDDDANVSAANITSANGTRNTIVPAGGVAVLYAGGGLNFEAERFMSAWDDNVVLIGVNGLGDLTATDSIGLWPTHASYMADAIPGATSSPRRTFSQTTAAINFATDFPVSAEGRSIAWSGIGTITSGSSWVASQSGSAGAFTSQQTIIEGAAINSIADRGNPGVLPGGSASSGLIITEIMFAPDSPLATVGFTQADFEWIEIYNNTGNDINFSESGYVLDDDDGGNIAAANMNAGILAQGQIGVLFNGDRITTDDMKAMWGESYEYFPLSNWPLLNNDSGGDTISIWPSHLAYNSEPVVDSGRTHQNAIASVSYDTRSTQGWPTVNNQSSIWLQDLSGDPNDGGNWKRAGSSGDLISRQASAIFAEVVDHIGGDVGSPGVAPGIDPVGTPGDFNNNGVVDAADYVLWRELLGTVSAFPNDPNNGTIIDGDQFQTWAANFGKPGAGNATAGVIPEPMSIWLIMLGLLLFVMVRYRS